MQTLVVQVQEKQQEQVMHSVVVVVASVDWNLSEEEMWCCYNVDFQEVQLHSLEVEGLEDHLIPSKQ